MDGLRENRFTYIRYIWITYYRCIKKSRQKLTLELRTFLYTFVYGGVVFDTDARNVKHKL